MRFLKIVSALTLSFLAFIYGDKIQAAPNAGGLKKHIVRKGHHAKQQPVRASHKARVQRGRGSKKGRPQAAQTGRKASNQRVRNDQKTRLQAGKAGHKAPDKKVRDSKPAPQQRVKQKAAPQKQTKRQGIQAAPKALDKKVRDSKPAPQQRVKQKAAPQKQTKRQDVQAAPKAQRGQKSAQSNPKLKQAVEQTKKRLENFRKEQIAKRRAKNNQVPQQTAEQRRQQMLLQALTAFDTTPFVKEPKVRGLDDFVSTENYVQSNLGYGGQRARTEQYKEVAGYSTYLDLPTAPIIHPYDPTGGNERGYLTPAFTLNLKLPSSFLEHASTSLPEALLRNLIGIKPTNIDAFLEVQDMPWTPGTRLLFRPQYWLDPNAPNQSLTPYSKEFTVQVGLFSKQAGGPVIERQPANGLLEERGISTHNNPGSPLIVSSANTLPIYLLDVDQTHVFFSLTKHGDRAAVVKHILLNPADEVLFERSLAASTNPRQLRENMRRTGGFSRGDLADEFEL